MVDPTSLWVRVLPSPYPAKEYPPYSLRSLQNAFVPNFGPLNTILLNFSRRWRPLDVLWSTLVALWSPLDVFLLNFGRLWRPLGRLWSSFGRPLVDFGRLWTPLGAQGRPESQKAQNDHSNHCFLDSQNGHQNLHFVLVFHIQTSHWPCSVSRHDFCRSGDSTTARLEGVRNCPAE